MTLDHSCATVETNLGMITIFGFGPMVFNIYSVLICFVSCYNTRILFLHEIICMKINATLKINELEEQQLTRFNKNAFNFCINLYYFDLCKLPNQI